MKNFFYDKFEEVYDFEHIRSNPLSNDELKVILPYSEDRIEYLRLFKELYQEALLFHCQPRLGLIKHNTYENELKNKYKALLDFCLLKNLFDYEFYIEFGGDKKEWDKHYISLSHLIVKVFRYTEYKSAYVIETLDEYRLRNEEYFASLDNWYLRLRYNVSETYEKESGEYISKLLNYDNLTECTYEDIKILHKQINSDLQICESAIEEMADLIPNELDTDFFDKYYQWFDRRKKLDYEHSKIEECLSTIENIVEEYDFEEDIIVPEFQLNRILYVYFGDVICHKEGHNIIQATAIVSGRNGSKIELNVEYCKECDKYLLRFQSFEEYRKKYGLIIGNFRELHNDQFYGDYFDLALESPLKMSGYTVAQKEGLSQKERHYILATIIHNRIMSKGEVIRYLNYFIKMQGAKAGNEIAVRKWRDDLMFVQEYDKDIQPKAYISEIKKY